MAISKRLSGVSTALALSALLATALFAQEQPPVPAFPAAADAITADVVVLDKDGRPVRGLTKDDFTLLEDGRAQTLVGFEARELLAPNAEVVPKIAVAEERVAANAGSASRHGRRVPGDRGHRDGGGSEPAGPRCGTPTIF